MLESHTPFQIFLKRFFSHRLALIGSFFLIAVGLGVVLIPEISPTDPSTTRPWLGMSPPGTQFPLCLSENQFKINEDPLTSPALKNAQSIVLELKGNEEQTEYRVVLRRGKIRTIQQGVTAYDEVSFKEGYSRLEAIDANGKVVTNLPPAIIKKGDKPPITWLQNKKQRVLIFRAYKEASNQQITIEMQGGICKSIQQNGNAIEQTSFDGKQIIDIKLDGKSGWRTFHFGSDQLGRDLFVRVFYGGRISVMVGLTATFVSLFIGLLYGTIAGYLGGKWDRLMMAFTDILYGLPFIFLVILLMVCFGRNLFMFFLALGAVQWLTMARIARGQVVVLRTREYLDAARMSGATTWNLIFKHLIPHTLGPVIVYTTLTVPVVIMEESFLAFLGLQIQYNNQMLDSWGALIKEGIDRLGNDGQQSWLLLFPASVMVITLVGLNALGDGLRDCLDPKEH
ncbi:MAG: ABC transporter permease [Lentisphaeria bacterium]|nr:ABC transporter permease [Lentisphaeria bacterium]